MASLFVIGQKGSDDLWLVDTASESVRRLSSEERQSLEPGFVDRIQAIRRNGFEVLKNVDVAIAAESAEELTGREFSQNG